MKSKFNLFLAALLIFICCIGAASAADDINDDSLTIDDDAVVVEQVDDVDLQSDESDDTALEVNNEENENLRATSVTVTNWSQLAGNASSSGDKTINLASGVTYTPTSQIVFGNNAKIVGTSTSYISGSYSGIPFYNSNSNYHITFQNVNFKDISCTMLMQMLSSGTTVLDGCTFTNVNASSSGHNSVIYNNYGTMNITDCTFTNCRAAFGVVTNHNAASTTNVIMNVRGSTFENNYGYTEPGCINNCGQLYVWTSTFNNNHAVWWAGAIHTHTNAKSVIRSSSFNGNTAGWNGGALYTYSELEVYDSNFTNNNCSYPQGGGAIGASNYFWASNAYKVYVSNCKFTDNNNLATNGNGGAIAAMNGGNLTVIGSTFTHNSADNGQAICGFNTNEYANISEGEAHLVIKNNMFLNHNIKTGTTVKLSGIYTFAGNTFINSPQIAYNSNNNYYGPIITQNNQNKLSSIKNQDILGNAYLDELSDSEIVINPSELNTVARDCENNAVIIVRKGTITQVTTLTEPKNITIIGEDRENTFVDTGWDLSEYGMGIMKQPYMMTGNGESINKNGLITWVNITFICQGIKLSDTNYNFINCTFINVPIEFGEYRESNPANPTSMDVYNYAFENCDFVNYTQTNVIIGHKFSNVVVSNCNFDNVTSDSIISTNANRTDDSGRKAGVTINDSTLKDVTIKGVVKTTDKTASNVNTDNKYDFVTLKTATFGGIVYVDVPANATTLTVKVVDIKEGEDFTIDVTLSNNLTANVTVTINKQQYNVSVVNGTGSLKVTDKLAANTYDVEASYAGEYPYAASTNTTTFKVEKVSTPTSDKDKQTPTTKVTKKATKITAKKKTFKAKKKTKKYTIVLKAGKTLVKKVKVTLKVGKKTYKATTNSKGKATFKITKLNKKGKYTAVIKFKGNKYYKATSKKVKITVKK